MATLPGLRIRLELDGKTLYEASWAELPDVLRIGRASDCGCRTPPSDKSISSHHARIEKTGKGLFVCDDSSKNGVFCGMSRITRKKAEAGDVYAIGESRLYIESDVAAVGRPVVDFHKLEQLSGAEKGTFWKLDKPVVKVGSDFDVDIRIPDLMVSKHHASFETKPDGSCWVKDLGSRNGTKVNGVKMSADAIETGRMLKDGDVISVAYVDYRFLDRRVEHVRSHILRNCAVVMVTIALALGGWFGYRTMAPDAIHMRLLAEKKAANGLFDVAEQLLVEARDARGADEDAERRGEMLRKLQSWKASVQAWDKARRDLSGESPDFMAINSAVASLVSVNDDNWKWNGTSAPAEGRKVRVVHDTLTAYIVAKEIFSAAEPTDDRIKALCVECERALNEANTLKEAGGDNGTPQYMDKILSGLKDLVAEMKVTREEYGKMMTALAEYDSIEKGGATLNTLRKVYDENKRRSEARRKESRPVSMLVVNVFRTMSEPVERLTEAYDKFAENCRAVARMDYASFGASLPLPDAQKCFAHPSLSARRAELMAENEAVGAVIRQLRSFQLQFSAAGLEQGKRPEVFAKLEDADRLEKVLSCDCLNHPCPGYLDTSRVESVYDEMLGVYAFYAYLSSLDEDFDTSVLDQRFKPVVFKVPDIMSLADAYRTFVSGGSDKKMSGAMTRVRNALASDDGNAVVRWNDYMQELIDAKGRIVRDLVKKFKSNKDSREGIIAGGIACVLGTKGVVENVPAEVFESFRKLRKSVGERLLSEGQSTSEQRSRVEAEVLQIGIPGDSYLKQPWADAFKKEASK